MATTVAYLGSTSYSAANARTATLGPMAKTTSSGFLARSGVIPSTATALQPASAGTLFVSVAPGQAVVDGQYLVTHDASVNVLVDAGGAATRWDAIILRVQESALGDTANQATVAVVKGTSASIPTLPARSLLLGTVVVGAGVTSINSSNMVDRRVFTTATGGMLYTTSIPTTSDLTDGQLAYNGLTATTYQRRGSSIVPLVPVKYGTFAGTTENDGGGGGFYRIPFTVCGFDGVPPNTFMVSQTHPDVLPYYWKNDGGSCLIKFRYIPSNFAHMAAGQGVFGAWASYR